MRVWIHKIWRLDYVQQINSALFKNQLLLMSNDNKSQVAENFNINVCNTAWKNNSTKCSKIFKCIYW